MVSAEAILLDHQDNVIDRTQLPLCFDISGKGMQRTKVKNARKRVLRGVSAQRHSNYLSPHLDNFLDSDIHTYSVAPGIIPAVSSSVNPSAWDPQHVDNGQWGTSHMAIPIEVNRQISKSVLCLFCSPLTSSDLRQRLPPLCKDNDWKSFGYRSFLAHGFCTQQCVVLHDCTTTRSILRIRR